MQEAMQTHRGSGPKRLSKLWLSQHSLDDLLVSKFIFFYKSTVLQTVAIEQILAKGIKEWKTKVPQIYSLRTIL